MHEIMNTKLTLSLEHEVIEKAKAYARTNGRSLSDIIENYLKSVILREKDPMPEMTPLVKSLKGAFPPPESWDYKNELQKILSDKYGS